MHLDEETLWTREQVAEFLNVHVNTVGRMCKRDGLPHLKLGRAIRFRPADVRAWVGARVAVARQDG